MVPPVEADAVPWPLTPPDVPGLEPPPELPLLPPPEQLTSKPRVKINPANPLAASLVRLV